MSPLDAALRDRSPDAAPGQELGLPAGKMLLRVREAAVALSMTEKALRHRVARGQIPVVHIGASVFIRRADLLRLMAEGRGLSPSGSR